MLAAGGVARIVTTNEQLGLTADALSCRPLLGRRPRSWQTCPATIGRMLTTPAKPATPDVPTDQKAMQVTLLAMMAIWGLNLSVLKWLIGSQSPMSIVGVRMVVAALFLTVALRWWLRRPWPRLSRRQWLWLLACAVLMVYINQILFIQGVNGTSAANAALIISLNPLLASLMATAALRERIGWARVVGMALGFGGVAAVVLHRPGQVLGLPGLGDALVLASVATWVTGGAMVQRLAGKVDVVTISWVIHTAGAVMLVVHLAVLPAPLHWATLTPLSVTALVLSGLLATGAGALVWNRALVTLGVARTALYSYWVPIFGVLFAVLLLGEPLSVWHGVGLGGVLAGTWLGTRRA